MEILGVRVDSLAKSEIIAKIGELLKTENGHFLSTPNPEIALSAHRDPAYRAILNSSDIAAPDGIGLKFAAWITGQKLPERVSGTDLIPEICRLARENGLSVGLVGGRDRDAALSAAQKLREWGNAVAYADYGVPEGEWDNAASHDKIIREINASKTQVLFVGFGHPKQEKWIAENREKLPNMRLFMGCGGAIDFLAGRAKRAPKAMRALGLEWLWRLATEPKRWKRIFNAVVIFPLVVISNRIRN